MKKRDRRRVLRFLAFAMLPTVLAGCVENDALTPAGFAKLNATSRYGELHDGLYIVPAVDLANIDPQMLRQVVDFPTRQPAGTIIVDTAERHLYLVESGDKAVRYGIGVGKAGLAFEGEATIKRKAEWPHWSPTETMMTREPSRYRKWAMGMSGGLGNPLGARAMYLYRGEEDTMFRIHGTTQPESIGQAVSSGCIRLIDQDVIDLYGRVKLGTRVVVRQASLLSMVPTNPTSN